VLQEKEIRRAQEEAVRNRKRSSRLVMKELEREAQHKEEERIRQLEERMQRVRDEEARREAEEKERINRQRGREERLREREERIREREERLRYREIEEIQLRERSEREPETRLRRRDLGLGGSMSRQNSQASEVPSRTRGRRRENEASPEDWEVACEICNRHGWNIVSTVQYFEAKADLLTCRTRTVPSYRASYASGGSISTATIASTSSKDCHLANGPKSTFTARSVVNDWRKVGHERWQRKKSRKLIRSSSHPMSRTWSAPMSCNQVNQHRLPYIARRG
jgi:hypothetical protein